MQGIIEQLLLNILKQQNKHLIKMIAVKCNKNEEEMLKKYHTPTFYAVVVPK
jgi:hypothetical protein